MGMPVNGIVLHILEPYWYSMTAAFWAQSPSVADGRVCLFADVMDNHIQHSALLMGRYRSKIRSTLKPR
jgi:hypothetical protein